MTSLLILSPDTYDIVQHSSPGRFQIDVSALNKLIDEAHKGGKGFSLVIDKESVKNAKILNSPISETTLEEGNIEVAQLDYDENIETLTKTRGERDFSTRFMSLGKLTLLVSSLAVIVSLIIYFVRRNFFNQICGSLGLLGVMILGLVLRILGLFFLDNHWIWGVGYGSGIFIETINLVCTIISRSYVNTALSLLGLVPIVGLIPTLFVIISNVLSI